MVMANDGPIHITPELQRRILSQWRHTFDDFVTSELRDISFKEADAAIKFGLLKDLSADMRGSGLTYERRYGLSPSGKKRWRELFDPKWKNRKRIE